MRHCLLQSSSPSFFVVKTRHLYLLLFNLASSKLSKTSFYVLGRESILTARGHQGRLMGAVISIFAWREGRTDGQSTDERKK